MTQNFAQKVYLQKYFFWLCSLHFAFSLTSYRPNKLQSV